MTVSEATPATRPMPPRSTFVTVLAWIFIVLGGMATLLFFGAMADLPSRGGADAQAFQVFFLFGVAINVLFVVGFTVLFGWIVKRLLSPDIRREFVADGA